MTATMEQESINVKEFQARMGIGRSKAYELTREPGFPSIHHRGLVLVLWPAAQEWLLSNHVYITRRSPRKPKK